jgi:hypothetical protein
VIEKTMNGKSLSVLVLVFLLVNILIGASSLLSMRSYEGAYITEAYYPSSEICQEHGAREWNFTVGLVVNNVDCSDNASGQAWFFFKIYRNEEIWWDEYNDSTHKVWSCDVGAKRHHDYKILIPTWVGPKNHEFKIELYWYNDDVSKLQDITRFTVTCVLLLDPLDRIVFAYMSLCLFVIVTMFLYFLANGRLKIQLHNNSD